MLLYCFVASSVVLSLHIVKLYAYDRIGDPDRRRGISGGQRKRVNVAMELVLDPSILFLDEPTTGLDSASALDLTQALKLLAESRNLTIAAVIHQPSTKVLARLPTRVA